ncbi:Alkaline phosphatase synthesis sensor protein PhoR [compost metagenome]
MLLLSTLDHNEAVLVRKPYSLKRQLRQVLQLMEWQLAEKELAVRLVVPEHDQVKGDEVLLLQVWTNLLSNAVKHVPAGRSIEIQVSCGEKECEVIVTDMGDGIPDEQLPFIYDRFYRGDRARQRATGSTGLGLSIVQKIIHLHGGTIEVASEVGKGTSFRVWIPQ